MTEFGLNHKNSTSPARHNHESVSTILLGSGVLLGLALLLYFAPMEALSSGLGNVPVWARAAATLWMSTPILILLGWVCQVKLRWRQAANFIRGTQVINPVAHPEFSPAFEALQTCMRNTPIEVRVRGNWAELKDDGRPLMTTPMALALNDRGAIIVPALVLARFRRDPKALGAVFAHEASHIVGRDTALLFDARFLMWLSIGLGLVLATLGWLGSVLTDISTGATWEKAALAGVVGKNSQVVTLLFVAIAALLHRRMAYWREALADAAAIRVCGAEVLARAERLFEGEKPGGEIKDRATLHDIQRAHGLTFLDVGLAGFLAQALAGKLSGPIQYLYDTYFSNSTGGLLLSASASFLFDLVILGSSVLVLTAVAREPRASLADEAHSLATSALALLSGMLTAHVLLETTPLVLATVAMPSGFEPTKPVSALPAYLAGFGFAPSAAASVLLALVAAIVARRASLAVAMLVPVIWLIVSTIESVWFPTIAMGWLAIGATILTLGLTARRVPAEIRCSGFRAWWPAVVILCLSMLGLFGFASDSHLGECARVTGARAVAANDKAGAMRALAIATWFKRWDYAPWLNITQAALLEPTDRDAAIVFAERAAQAPYLNMWDEKLVAYFTVGHLLLQRGTPSDNARAKEWLERAASLWFSNRKLTQRYAAYVLYRLAVAELRNDSTSDAAAYLIEALALEPTLRAESQTDVDLAGLTLATQLKPSTSAVKILLQIGPNAQEIRRAVATGKLSSEELPRLAALLASPRQ